MLSMVCKEVQYPSNILDGMVYGIYVNMTSD